MWATEYQIHWGNQWCTHCQTQYYNTIRPTRQSGGRCNFYQSSSSELLCAKLESDCGLLQLVDLNTRGSVTLDKFLTNRPDLFQSVSVFSSIVKTDHKAVLVKPTASQSSDLPRTNTQAHVRSVMYNHSPLHIGNLCKALENYSWTGLLLAIEHKTVDVDCRYCFCRV